jgi:excisionase family DNA binding protein
MAYSNLPHVFTPKEIADYLKIESDAVLQEFEDGRLRGFKAGSEWRCTDANLLEYVNRNQTISLATQSEKPQLKYETTDLVQIDAFDYHWPKDVENFEYGYETTRKINGHEHTFKIGFTNREAAGKMRRRIIIWLNNWPVVEFAGGNNFENDGLLASVIKLQNGKQLRSSGKIPDEYKDFHVDRYDSLVQGPYASRNMAVIVSKDDFETMIRHAVIRATWKQLL